MLNSATFNQVSIANMALSLIGGPSTISNIAENSAEAQQIRIWYDYSLLQTLQAYNWNFARRRIPLVAFTDTPDYSSYEFRYHDLTDMVAIRAIWNPAGELADAVPYEKEFFGDEATVLTNMEDAVAVCTTYVTNPAFYPPGFIESLAANLAYHIAFPLTGSRDVQQTMLGIFRIVSKAAAASDANEQQAAPPRDADTVRARH